jgi:hypothetical protein
MRTGVRTPTDTLQQSCRSLVPHTDKGHTVQHLPHQHPTDTPLKGTHSLTHEPDTPVRPQAPVDEQ